MKDNRAILQTEALSIGYRSKSADLVIAGDLNLSLEAGKLVCLLGENGSGKSTLMRTLAGLQPALAGKILLGQRELARLKPQELATQLSLVLTERLETGNLTAREVITLGRTPYTGWLGQLSDADRRQIDLAIAYTATESLLNRQISQLSDGERQKVMLARALTQDTGVILLDEPTAHLDLPNRIGLMKLLHRLAAETNKAILLSTHELDLALQTADQLWLMKKGGGLLAGVPEDLILNGSFESVFNQDNFFFDTNTGTFNIQREPTGEQVYLEGSDKEVLWTKKALQRAGFSVSNTADSRRKIKVMHIAGERVMWEVSGSGSPVQLYSIAALITFLTSQ
ncbi:ABC transporter ATP-binding protein [Dyadobacter sp. Leaf189]|uniref:ABC transporter ATP-binding protein n=1 Tax=Dyadobacter sp. Leaf189 TaxID=1736295 RepID=UPI0009EC6727|nr:ABC transporter ATP-binding protein [Dyadobacter sp. Leaf189]